MSKNVPEIEVLIGSVEWSAEKVRQSRRLYRQIMEILDPPMRGIGRWEDDGGAIAK